MSQDSLQTEGSRRLDSRATPIALLLLCLTLAAAGEIFISSSPSFAWIGIASFAASFVTLLLLIRSLEGGRLTRIEDRLFRLIGRNASNVPGMALVALGLAGSLAATWYSQTRVTSAGGWPSFALWLVGVLAISALAIREALRGRADSAALLSPFELAGIIGVTAVAFALRFVRLAEVPYPISGDEASVGLEGIRILSGSNTQMFRTGWSSQPYLSFLGPALTMSQFGENLIGLRLFPVLAGTLTVPILYLLVRSMFSRAAGFLAAILLATMAFHIHFSRIAVNNADAAFLVCAVAGSLYALAVNRRSHWFITAGLAVGFSLYSFAGARLAFPLAFLFLAYLFATDKAFRRDWPKLLLFAVAVGVVVLPTAAHFLQHPDIGFGRLRQMGVFDTGWLTNEATETGHSAPLVLGRQVFRSFAIFVSAPAFSGFYNSPKPLLDPFWSIAFLLGMMFSWSRPLDRRSVLLNIWFWSVIVLGGALILPPPAPERFLLAAPAVAAFAALGIWNLWSIIGRLWGRQGVTLPGALATVFLLAVGSLMFYFREYTPRYYFTDANSEVGTELGRYLTRRPSVHYVYFTGLPRMFYRSIASTDFLSGGVPGEDFPAGTVPDIRGKGRPLIFVALPHLRSELTAIQRVYPGGKLLVHARRPRPSEPLFVIYRID